MTQAQAATRRFAFTFFVLAPALLGACAGDGGSPAESPADEASDAGAIDATTDARDSGSIDLARYELTSRDVDRYFDAGHDFAEALRSMSPAERTSILDEDDTMSPTDENYPAFVEQQIERHRAMRQAVEGAGLSPREYAVISVSLTRAWVAHHMAAAQPDAAGAPSMGATPQNIAYVREHVEELQTRFEALGAEMEGME